jgi:beta-galactosidase
MDQVKATMESGFGAVLDVPGLNYRCIYMMRPAKFPGIYFRLRNSFNGWF